MSYIGYSQAANHIAPPHIREVLSPDGSATYFDLQNDVVGFHEENVIVVVNNVIQEPHASYTIKNDANNQPKRLDFAGVALASTDSLYVIHQGTGTIYNTPAAGSVTKTSMAANLVSHVVDKFAGSDATSGSTILALSETPTNADAISVYVNGVYQRAGAGGSNNYSVTGSNLTFTSALASTDQIDIHHHTFRSTTTKVADASVGTTQLADDAVTAAKIADDAIGAAAIADGAIDVAAKIADDAITGGKLANDIAISTTGNIATTGSGTLTVAGATNLASVATGTLASAVVFPAGHVINVTAGSIATETVMTTSSVQEDVLTVTPTLKQAGNKYLLRAVLPVYHYTGGASMYYQVRIYRTTSTAAIITMGQILRSNETNTGETNNVVIEGFDLSPASSTEYKLQIWSSTTDSRPTWCTNNANASLIIQEIQV